VSELRQTASRVPGGRVSVSALGALHQAAAASSHDATRRLHRIQAPTLVLHGSEDELVPVANATWLASRIPRAQLRVVRGGTHLLVLESPAARRALRNWLDEHSTALPVVNAPSAVAWVAGVPCRVLLGQTLPLRRVIRAGSRRVRRPPL
jgi:predicted dienelactone hydrolase